MEGLNMENKKTKLKRTKSWKIEWVNEFPF